MLGEIQLRSPMHDPDPKQYQCDPAFGLDICKFESKFNYYVQYLIKVQLYNKCI